MVRPRISPKEAAYLVTVLKLQLEKLREEEQQLREVHRELVRIKIKLPNWYCGNWEKLAQVEAYQEVKAEIQRLEKRSHKVWKCIEIHDTLIKKYSAIAEGTATRGTYKHLNSGLWLLNGKLEPEQLAQVVA